jgi:hypothetical protein
VVVLVKMKDETPADATSLRRFIEAVRIVRSLAVLRSKGEVASI